ncbi:MAG: glycosyltransferase family 4 protein [Anaerolineae bacterium]|nr:glycosyltransferase family 4 protein [Anaerolineae bacterium]
MRTEDTLPPKQRVLFHIVTVPLSLVFFSGQLRFMQARGFDIHVMSSPGELLDRYAGQEAVTPHAVEMPRRITPVQDLLAVRQIWQVLRAEKPVIVHGHTPKGGLLGMIAAWLAHVPVRVYQVRGLPFLGAAGLKRALLRGTEQVSCLLAHRVICNSASNLEVIVSEGICPRHKATVLLNGSGNGVDAEGRFNPARYPDARGRIRQQFGIPHDAVVIGFVGRMVHDKGVDEMIAAWQMLREDYPQLHLLFVGSYEPQDPIAEQSRAAITGDERIHVTGLLPSWDVPPYYLAMDVMTLPSHREGFPNVVLEAGAMGLPVVATRIPGCVDALKEGETGALVPVDDADSLAHALERYVADVDLRAAHGQAGQVRARHDFRPEAIWEALHLEYEGLLEQAGWGRR